MNGLPDSDILDDFLRERYEVLTTLDNKDESETFLVMQTDTRGIYVIKQVSTEVYQVARSLVGIKHPNIAQIRYVYQKESKCYLVEEYVNGMTIDDLIEHRGTIPKAEATEIVYQILEGLSVIHNAGIVHRDIKPTNLIISQDGVVKILDFGISRKSKAERSKDTVIMGTQGYAAPEQYGFEQTDGRADIYSVGVLYNVLLTGEFPGDSACTDPQLRMIIEKATAIDREDRFLDVGHMQDAIRPECSNRLLPGFRSGVRWKKIVSVVTYIVCIAAMMICVIDACRRDGLVMSEYAGAMLSFVLAPLIAGGIFFWDEEVTGICKLGRRGRLVVRIIVASMLFMIGLVLLPFGTWL